MTQKHYLLVVAPGPLMILRVPWPMPRWRSILQASTAVMRSHGLRQKDIHSLDGLVGSPSDRDAEDRALVARVDAGYEGSADKVPGFWLYDWRGTAFKLARAATEIS